MSATLELEVNPKQLKHHDPSPRVLITPAISPEFWLWRVKVSDKQAVVAFPKFGVIGIGFQIEDADWNTNLPSNTPANEIFDHIKHNKGDEGIPDNLCIEAIELLQKAIKE